MAVRTVMCRLLSLLPLLFLLSVLTDAAITIKECAGQNATEEYWTDLILDNSSCNSGPKHDLDECDFQVNVKSKGLKRCGNGWKTNSSIPCHITRESMGKTFTLIIPLDVTCREEESRQLPEVCLISYYLHKNNSKHHHHHNKGATDKYIIINTTPPPPSPSTHLNKTELTGKSPRIQNRSSSNSTDLYTRVGLYVSLALNAFLMLVICVCRKLNTVRRESGNDYTELQTSPASVRAPENTPL